MTDDLQEEYTRFQHIRVTVGDEVRQLCDIQPFFINSTFQFTHDRWPSYAELLVCINESSIRKLRAAYFTFLTRISPDVTVHVDHEMNPNEIQVSVHPIDGTASLLSICWSIRVPVPIIKRSPIKIKHKQRLVNFLTDLFHS